MRRRPRRTAFRSESCILMADPRPSAIAGDRFAHGAGIKRVERVSDMPATHPVAEAAAPVLAPEQVSLGVRLVTLAAIILPILGLVAAALLVWGWGFSWIDFGLLVGMYLLTALGITVGFHRLFVHRSFETNIVVKVVLAVLGDRKSVV